MEEGKEKIQFIEKNDNRHRRMQEKKDRRNIFKVLGKKNKTINLEIGKDCKN